MAKRDIAATASFIQNWLARQPQPGGGAAYPALEIDRLAAQLTADARTHGITGGDIHRAVGDIDDYLAAQTRVTPV